jgi:hypothetical protein
MRLHAGEGRYPRYFSFKGFWVFMPVVTGMKPTD